MKNNDNEFVATLHELRKKRQINMEKTNRLETRLRGGYNALVCIFASSLLGIVSKPWKECGSLIGVFKNVMDIFC